MSDIINLKQFKKRKARAEQQQQANANRHLFGRTKTQKNFDRLTSEKTENFLINNRLEPVGARRPENSDGDEN